MIIYLMRSGLLVLLFSTNVFVASQSGLLLTQELCKEDLQKEKEQIPEKVTAISQWLQEECGGNTKRCKPADILWSINDALLMTSTAPDILKELGRSCPFFNQRMNDIGEYAFKKKDNLNILYNVGRDDTQQVHPVLRNYVISRCIQNSCINVVIPYTGDRHKASVKCISDKSAVLFQMITKFSSTNLGSLILIDTKEISLFDLHAACLVLQDRTPRESCKEFLWDQNIDEKDKWGLYFDKYAPEYFKKSQLDNHMDSFSDGSYIVTHPWGGFEYHTNDKKTYYCSIDKKISSVSCSSNNHYIALGSFDGTITIVNMDTLNEDCNKGYYEKNDWNEFLGYRKEKEKIINYKPKILTIPASTDSIIYIKYKNDDTILFATNNRIASFYSNTTSDIVSETEGTITAVSNYHNDDNNIIAYAQDNGKLSVLLNGGVTIEYQTEKKEAIVNALCMYIDADENTYMLVGFSDGVLSILRIPLKNSKYSNQELFEVASIQHDHPIYSIEISSDNNRIVVKTTEHDTSINPEYYVKYIDHVKIYSSFQNLQRSILDCNKQFRKLRQLCTIHNNNPQILYTILANNIHYLKTHPSSKNVDFEQEISDRILRLLDNQQISSLVKLKELLVLFPEEIRIGHPPFVKSGMLQAKIPKDHNPLSQLHNRIIKKQQTLFAQIIKQYLNEEKYTQEELDRFADKFDVKIDWEKLEDNNSTDLSESISPASFLLSF